MSSGKTFVMLLIAYTVAVWIAVMLLIWDTIGITAFLILIAVFTIALMIPLVGAGGTEARVADGMLMVKAPMVDLRIPLSTITSIECRHDFKPGLRIFGYGGLRRGSGDFTNAEFSSYTYAGDSRIHRFIVIGYGRGKIAAFNFRDEASTESLYRQIAAESGAKSVMVSDSSDSKKRYSRTVKLVTGIVAGTIVLIIALIAILLSAGHIDVSMDDDSITIDATMMKEDILYSEISSIELREDFDAGTRIGGYGTHDISSGKFRNSEFGKYRLAMHNDVDTVIVIHLEDRVVVFNMESISETESTFHELDLRVESTNIHTCCAIPIQIA